MAENREKISSESSSPDEHLQWEEEICQGGCDETGKREVIENEVQESWTKLSSLSSRSSSRRESPSHSSPKEKSSSSDSSHVEQSVSESSSGICKESCTSNENTSSSSSSSSSQSSSSSKSSHQTASPFFYDGHSIKYNTSKGVPLTAPVIFGSNKNGGSKEKGFRANRFYFDPELGSLCFGRDSSGQWGSAGKYSLIGGYNNKSNVDGSVVFGSSNSISYSTKGGCGGKHGLPPPSFSILSSEECSILTDCSTNTGVAMIGCKGTKISNSNCTVILALDGNGDEKFTKYGEAVISRNYHAISKVEQDGSVSGGGFYGRRAEIDEIYAKNIHVSSPIQQQSLYTTAAEELVIESSNSVDVLYVNPTGGNVKITLGTPESSSFQDNRAITVKDVSLNFAQGTAFNIYISPAISSVPSEQVYIENYSNGKLIQSQGPYVLNSTGGSVTLRYVAPLVVGGRGVWVIDNQYIGNPRLPSSPSSVIKTANAEVRKEIVNNHRAQ